MVKLKNNSMREKVIGKKELPGFLKAIGQKYKVFGPVKKNGNFTFLEITDFGKIYLDYPNSKSSPKGLFFPQSEVLYRFEVGQTVIDTELKEQPMVIFGIRPCDVRALLLLDKVFDEKDFKDPYYLKKRENAIIISLACNRPQISCFCTSLDSGPDDKQGSDIIIFDLEKAFLVKVITKRAESFIKPYQKCLSPVKKSDLARKDELIKESKKKINSQIPIKGLKEKLDGLFEDPFWDRISQRCLGCGICTYLCSTCYCFDITDEAIDLEGKRLRTWDSCMFGLFTLQASGHNPRPTKKERLRQRIMHKFNYYAEQYGQFACVGCGRCVRECPVNLDIRELITEVAKS